MGRIANFRIVNRGCMCSHPLCARPSHPSFPQASTQKSYIISEEPKKEDVKKNIVVAITSDRGLCGSVNSAVSRWCKAYFREHGADSKFFMFGEKARSATERDCGRNMLYSVNEHNKRRPASFALVSAVTEKLLAHPHDQLTFVYNRFVSAISYSLETDKIYSLDTLTKSGNANLYDYNFDGHKEEILKDLHEFRVASLFFSMNIENGTSEQSSRMQAMENSSKNAKEMLNTLSIQYNKARQTKITTELIEIISGVSALNG
jgi:F-type H+-transporting ATPase subunit gamma